MLARLLKYAVLGFCGLTAVLLGLYALSAHWPIPQAQRQALAQLRQPLPPLDGPTMFAALWSLPYVVPAAQWESVLALDVQQFKQLPPAAPPLCQLSGDACLQRVRQQPQAYADALATQTPRLRASRELIRYTHYRSPFPATASAPSAPWPRGALSMTANALEFVQGGTAQALIGVCGDAQVARVLLGSDDNLAMPSIGAAMLRGNAQLFAQMLAELPVDHTVPAQCRAAFAPLAPQDISLCRALRGESRLAFSSLRQAVDQQSRAGGGHAQALPGLLDRERTEALLAPTYTWACSAQVERLLAEDEAIPPAMVPVAQTRSLGCIANAVGCLLADVARPPYALAQHKRQDTAAAVRTVSALLWLRDHPAEAVPLAQRLAQLPPALRGTARPLRVGADEHSLRLQQYARSEHADIVWPLPASRLAAAPGGVALGVD
ncbi:hypothetical protein [Xanthomonas maliensis]|uniref:hypothetical protein n=1 Tax=Xanthomonas maliensis TaxID=1321368 RepID=UPI0003A58F9C|nr:hypothetical protein [Xanthomonas maliensis]KAB7762526.1 hypothetical protein CKY51_21115 [Xanthomonas maliensis]